MSRSRKILSWVIVFFWASEYCHSPYFTPYLTTLGFTSSVIGFVGGLYGFTQMLVRVPLGIYTDVQNAYKKVVVAGTLFTTVSSFWLMFAQSPWSVACCRILAGSAASTWLAFTVLYSAYYSAEEGVTAMTSATGFNNGGKLLAFVLGTLTASFWGYRIPLVCSTVTGFIAIVLALQLKEIPIQRKPLKIREVLGTFRDLSVLIPAAFAIVQQFVIHGTVFSFTSSVVEQMGGNPTEIGICSTLVTVVQVVLAGFVGKKLVPRMGKNRAIAAGFLLLTLYPVLVITAPSIWVVYLAQILVGFGCLLTYSILSAKAIEYVAPEKKSTAMGLFQALYGLGMTLGPIVVGNLARNGSYTWGYLLISVVAGLAMAAAVLILPALDRKMKSCTRQADA